MGTPAFSATVLEGLLTDERYDIVAVVTQPDRAVGRKKEIRMTPVKEVALAHDLPIYQPEKLSGSEEMAQLMALGADGIVTAAYGQFLPSKLLNSMDFAVNVHASLLPKYRGGAPIHYAIINGDAEAGVTIMEMVKEMDAGDMVSQKALPILDEDNVGTMFEKLAVLGRDLLLETLPAYIAGEILAQKRSVLIGINRLVTSSIKSVACTHGLWHIPCLTVNVSKFMRRTWQKVKDRLVISLKRPRRVW